MNRVDARPAYIDHLLSTVDMHRLTPLRIVVNAGNGGAGPVVDLLETASCRSSSSRSISAPDGNFPNGVPNPLLIENRDATAKVVVSEGADLGLAWDGDFDRCFFFDERGRFIEGYYLVGVLAQRALDRHPGSAIVHDPRLVWNTEEVVRSHGGSPVLSKSGHSFMKEKMREVDGAYGGEMSAHHYFRDFHYCDSGMIPWLQLVEAMCTEGRPLSDMVDERIARYPVSGEINLTVEDAERGLALLRQRYAGEALAVSDIDGISFEFASWRFNVRPSNTEPVLRVNVESRGNRR